MVLSVLFQLYCHFIIGKCSAKKTYDTSVSYHSMSASCVIFPSGYLVVVVIVRITVTPLKIKITTAIVGPMLVTVMGNKNRDCQVHTDALWTTKGLYWEPQAGNPSKNVIGIYLPGSICSIIFLL